MRKLYVKILLFCLLFILLSYSCDSFENKKEKKQLLIYCGITMIKPMTELKQIIEKEEGCIIEITKGGSGSLLKAIEASGIGDMYLPGSNSYIKTAFAKNLISDTVMVGYNRLAMLVQKGNPLNISPNLSSLMNKDYYVVIGNPYSGSVGKATKKALQSKGFFEAVERNAIRFTADSKGLTLALINKEADIVINWYAPYTWDNNSAYMDTIKIDQRYDQKNTLVLSTLKYSRYPTIAEKLLDLAGSERGKAIFKAYGF